MSLTVQSLNGDTAFLLTFAPPVAPDSSPGLSQASFTILIDPWQTGPATILSPAFSISERKEQPSISSLRDLDQEPDIILISQDKPDHCHRETLRQLPRDCQSTIVATASAARKIRSWNHFPPQLVHALPKYAKGVHQSIFRLALPPFSPQGTCGEVTVSWLPARFDLTGLHHAIGITYRPPCSALSARPGQYLDLPLSPPTSPASPQTVVSLPCTVVPSPNNDRERTLSVIYSPHGVPFESIHTYASSHLVNEAALPLTMLLHSFDIVSNPWYLGGNVSAGLPGGARIAQSLFAKAWVSAHDADKDNRGLSVVQTRIGKYAAADVKRVLDEGGGNHRRAARSTDVVSLTPGETYRVEVG